MASAGSSSSQQQHQYDFLFKTSDLCGCNSAGYISVGDSGVGKSCLLLRFVNGEFQPTETTIGIEFGSQIVKVKNRMIKLQIWDTAGQESFRSISRAYYRGAIGCLLVYDITRRETFNHLITWLEDVRQHGNEEIRTALVANKSDLSAKRQVSREEGEAFARAHNCQYHETSAKSGEGVERAFLGIAETIFEGLRLERGEKAPLPEDEVRKLESHGVKVGPRRIAGSGVVNLSAAPTAGGEQGKGGCC